MNIMNSLITEGKITKDIEVAELFYENMEV